MKKEPSKRWLEFRQSAPEKARAQAKKAGAWCKASFALEPKIALEVLKNGLIFQNPVLVFFLGLCSALAVSASLKNGLAMGLVTTAVLLLSNLVVSLLRKRIPNQIRIAAYLVVAAAFATWADLILQAYFPALSLDLGVFVPLIAVNVLLSARADDIASKHTPAYAALDGLATGLGFTLALCLLGTIRELLGAGALWGRPLFGPEFPTVLLVAAPCGGFIVLGVLMALVRFSRIGPFLGAEQKLDVALGMGVSVTIVMGLASALTWLASTFLLRPFHLEYLGTLACVLIVAAIFQGLEVLLRKGLPALRGRLGVHLPLVTLNCAVLGVALLYTRENFNFPMSVAYGVLAGLGFTLALVLFSTVRERLEFSHCPKCFEGLPIALVTAGLLAMAFLGFSGLKLW